MPSKFKPFLGRCFTLKNYTNLEKYPKIILVMDEKPKEVMFLDNDGNAQWVGKFYLREQPVESRVFANPDTLTEAMALIEELRSKLVNNEPIENEKKKKDLNKKVAKLLQELRDLGNRTSGLTFAPTIEELVKAEEKKAKG